MLRETDRVTPTVFSPIVFLLSASILLGAALLFLFTPTYAEQAANLPDAPGKIAGIVTDEGGTPQANVYVLLYRYPFNSFYSSQWAYTDINGAYSFLGLNSGVYRVGFFDFSKTYGRQFWQDRGSYCDGQEISLMGTKVENIDAILHPGSVITGSLILPSLIGIERPPLVTLYQRCGETWQEYDTYILESGTSQFIFRGIATGTYRLCANANDSLLLGCYYSSTTITQAISLNDASDISVTSGITLPNHNIYLYRSPSLKPFPDGPGIGGKITSNDNEPLSGISVQLFSSNGGFYLNNLTDSDGKYFFYLNNYSSSADFYLSYGDRFGNYQQEFYTDAKTIETATPIHYEPRDRILNVDVQMENAAKITGKLQIIDGGIPQNPQPKLFQEINDEWELFIFGNAYAVPPSPLVLFNFDNSSGAYTVTGLREGKYRIGIEQAVDDGAGPGIDGYFGGTTFETATTLQLAAGETHTNTNIIIGTDQFEGIIQGNVTVAGIPKAGIKVELFRYKYPNPFLYVMTDAFGQYRVTGLANGLYRVRFSTPAENLAQEYYHAQASILNAQVLTVTGPTLYKEINAQMVPGGEISGVFKLQSDQSIGNVLVLLYPVDETTGKGIYEQAITSTSTNSLGMFSFNRLLPGTYQVQFIYSNETMTSYVFYDTYDSTVESYIPKNISVNSGETTTIEKRFGTYNLYLPIISD